MLPGPPSSRTLLELPREVLLTVRSHIHNLRDHVHFSLASRTLYNLYDERFWMFACFTSGWVLTEASWQAYTASAALVEHGETDSDHKNLNLWNGLARNVVRDATEFQGYGVLPFTATAEVIFEQDLESKLRNFQQSKEILEKTFKHGLVPFQDDTATKPFGVTKLPWIQCDWDKPQREMFTTWDDVHDIAAVFADPDEKPIHAHPFMANRLFTVPSSPMVGISDGKGGPSVIVGNQFGVTLSEALIGLSECLSLLDADYKEETSHRFFEGFSPFTTLNNPPFFEANWGS